MSTRFNIWKTKSSPYFQNNHFLIRNQRKERLKSKFKARNIFVMKSFLRVSMNFAKALQLQIVSLILRRFRPSSTKLKRILKTMLKRQKIRAKYPISFLFVSLLFWFDGLETLAQYATKSSNDVVSCVVPWEWLMSFTCINIYGHV